MNMNSGFQISLDVRGRPCLVIGGDEEAVEKIERLLDADAKVMVLNPTLHPTLRKLTASGRIIHRGRTFRTTDVHSGVTLVLNTLRDDPDLAKFLFDLAKTERFLVWSIDRPELSTVVMPAVVRRGHLRVAISTSGASPALAKALRQDLETVFDDEFVDCLNWLGSVREELGKDEPSDLKRRERLQPIVEGFRLTGKIEFPKSWLEKSESPKKNDG
jgi:precorrin-2 dehydrogenase/sirohydrochlorin ferrochelatase